MELIEKVKMNSQLKDMSLVVSCYKGRICLCFQHKSSGEQMIIQEFFGKTQYERWLCEAVLCRLAANKDKKCLKGIRNWHSRIFKFLQDKVKRNEEIIH